MQLTEQEIRTKEIHYASQIRTQWEVYRGFGNHLSAEEYASGTERNTLNEVFVLEGMLSKFLEEWFEHYEEVFKPDGVEDEVSEMFDMGAYALGGHIAVQAAHKEGNVTYSEEEVELAQRFFVQVLQGSVPKEFPEDILGQEEDFEQKLADMRQITVEFIKAYVQAVGAKTTESEIIQLVEAAHHFVKAAVLEKGYLTPEDNRHLKFFVMTPLIKDSPQGKTVISSDVDLGVFEPAYKSLEDFAKKYYGIDHFWVHVGLMYQDGGKNERNYPHPIPEGYESYQQYKEEVRAKFPGRVIPPDFNPYTDTPESYMQRWHEEHPGEEFVVKSKILDLVGIEEQLR